MPLKIDHRLAAASLLPKIRRMFELSAEKILNIEKTWKPSAGTPVFTVRGKYTSRGWTEWTQGFQFGSSLLQFDATGDKRFLEIGRKKTVALMASHVSHIGVHDHGFNNVSTYGNLWRLMRENKIPFNAAENDFYELALKISGAVQASRWTPTSDGNGYIYSFNGPHSLFVDTMRSLRSLALAHHLGHALMGERDVEISLLERLLQHAEVTARYNIYFGEGRDIYDLPGRTAHESIFNVKDGTYRCPNSQQGASPFTTWTRGLAWAILGYAEQLEFLSKLKQKRNAPLSFFLRAATITAEFYIKNCCTDGVPMWDTGAPNLHRLANYSHASSDPFNAWEPVDSSAAAIAAQGLMRLGNFLAAQGDQSKATRLKQAALTIADTLLDEPYISSRKDHQGLLLHSVYHRPKGWDFIGPKQKVPNGESSMWGDYHLRELGILLLREATADHYPCFFAPLSGE